MSNEITAVISLFLAVSIMLGIGMMILSNSAQDCTALPQYDSSLTTQTNGWVLQCEASAENTRNAFSVLVIITLLIATAAILFIVRLL